MPGETVPRRRVLLAVQTEELAELQVQRRPLSEYAALIGSGQTVTLDEVLVSVVPEGLE